MLIAFVIIASHIAVSSAQISPECAAAYNETFHNENTTGCTSAYFSQLSQVTPSNESERMMVCDADQVCNAKIENVISSCGDSVSSYS